MITESSGSASAVSWAAIIGGALTAVAITLLLVALGAGIGLSSVSPWSPANPSATTFTLLAAVWFIIVQWLSSGLGATWLAGYGRNGWACTRMRFSFAIRRMGFSRGRLLRFWSQPSRPPRSHRQWGRLRVLSPAWLAVRHPERHRSQPISPGSADYFLDTLFRRDQPDANASPQDARAEAGRILTRALASGTIDPGDRAYLAKLIAARTGISQQDAEKRIDDTVAQMKAAEEKTKQAADAARKASASASFYLFFSMLIGAFIASAAGAIGGRQRDL